MGLLDDFGRLLEKFGLYTMSVPGTASYVVDRLEKIKQEEDAEKRERWESEHRRQKDDEDK